MNTPSDIESFQAELLKMPGIQAALDEIRNATSAEINEISVTGGEDRVFNCMIPSTMIPNGSTAKELRDAGYGISKKIPDCAVMQNGKFEWVTVDFTI